MPADWGTGAWLKGTPGPDIVPQLTPKAGDIVVEGKKTLDAFHSTALDYLLRANEIEYVVFHRVPHQLVRRIVRSVGL